MALAEEGVATLLEAGRRVAGLLGGAGDMVGPGAEGEGGVGERLTDEVDTGQALRSPGANPSSDDHLQQVERQHTASHEPPRPRGGVAGRAGTNNEQLM